MDWGRKWLVDFNSGKTQLVLFDRSNNTDMLLMEKLMGLFFSLFYRYYFGRCSSELAQLVPLLYS